MKVEKIDSIKPGNTGNMFAQMPTYSGQKLGENVTVMYMETGRTRRLDHIIIIDNETGDRVRIEFPEAEVEVPAMEEYTDEASVSRSVNVIEQ